MSKITMPKKRSELQDYDRALRNIKRENKNKKSNVHISEIKRISEEIKNKIGVNEDIYAVFPDIKLGVEILVSSIISPNDMLQPTLTYNINNNDLPTSVAIVINDKIRNYIKDNYNITDKLYNIVEEYMYTKGAYVEMIISNEAINTMAKNMIRSGNENFVEDSSIVDKDNVVKNITIGDVLTISNRTSDVVKKDIIKVKSKLVKNRRIIAGNENIEDSDDLIFLMDTEKSQSTPLTKKIPIESVIPICNENDPSVHYGYFIVLDSTNTPVVEKRYGSTAIDILNSGDKGSIKSIMNRANTLIGGSQNTSKGTKLQNIDYLREELVISKLNKSIEGTEVGSLGGVNYETDTGVLDVVLNRILENKKTKIVFVPETLLSYFAYEYRDNGTGVSILEKVSVLASMRAIMTFVSLMSFVKSSIPITSVDVTLDPNDPDQEATKEIVMSSVMSNKQLNMPIGVLKVDDITSWLNANNIYFNFDGGDTDMKIDINHENVDISPANDDLKETIDKHLIQALGLTPEIIDNGYSPDFATTVIYNNILLSRRIYKYQTTCNTHITKHINKLLSHDGVIEQEIKDIILNNIKDIKKTMLKNMANELDRKRFKILKDEVIANMVYYKSIDKLKVSLPPPIVNGATNLADTYKDFTDNIDDVLDMLFDSDVLPDEIIGDFSDKVDTLKKLVKAIIIKRWLSENGYMPEVTELFTLDKDGKPIIDVLEEYGSYVDSLEAAIMPVLKEMNKTKKNINEKLEKIDNDDDENEDNLESGDTDETPDNDSEEENTDDSGSDENIDNEDNESDEEEPEIPEV